MKHPASRLLLCLALTSGTALANDNWLHLGEYYARPVRAMGAFSLNLDTLRRREHHFEIWERLTPLGGIGSNPPPATTPRPERLTLWAVRCRSGIMAKITEGISGTFEPRTEALRFFLPAPSSSGAAVIEATCSTVRRNAREKPPATADSGTTERAGGKLETPPEIALDEALESEEE